MLQEAAKILPKSQQQRLSDKDLGTQSTLDGEKDETGGQKQIGGIQNIDEDQMDQEVLKKKNENKQRYRRMKQKLTVLCEQHQQKCLIKDNKQVSSPNKSRLLTLAIQFEKITLNQTKDYLAIETKLKEIMKILDHRREHDLLILKQSRFIPAISIFLKKVPTFHKNQFNQCVKTVQLGMKLLRIFSTLSSNRDFLISTNQLVVLNSCLNNFICKEEKKLAIQCLSVIHQLMCSKIKADSEQIVNVTFQIVFIGQLARKIRVGIESSINEDGINEPEYVLKSLKYLYILYRKTFDKALENPIYQQEELPHFLQFHSDNLISLLHSILPKILLDQDSEMRDQELPICIINICLYIIKLLNLNVHINLHSSQKILEIWTNSQFSNSLKLLFQYSMDSIDNGNQVHEISCVCSEIMEFLGKIGCNSMEQKRLLYENGLLQKLYNHPISYIMDHHLKSILIPSLCSTMLGCEENMKKYLTQNSSNAITTYISFQKRMHEEMELKMQQQNVRQVEQKQNLKYMGSRSLSRKQSVSSLNSYTTECTQKSSLMPLEEEQKYTPKLINIVPSSQWDSLVQKLILLDG